MPVYYSKQNFSRLIDLNKAPELFNYLLSWVNMSQAESSWVKLSQAESSWVKLSQAESSWVKLSQAELTWVNLS
jgi:uncharacterized protein YjbI with pentapeptide repeats